MTSLFSPAFSALTLQARWDITSSKCSRRLRSKTDRRTHKTSRARVSSSQNRLPCTSRVNFLKVSLTMAQQVNENVELQSSVSPSESKALWVFGYGSLCWKPGFNFDKAVVGHVRGYSRKFWQGNITHRGTEDKPGRVATLIDDEQSSVYGVAFAVSGEDAIPYLTKRECTLGGYDTRFTTFYPLTGDPIKVLLYIATPKNNMWLGDAPMSDIAHQITGSSGPSGHNVEYLLRLVDFMRRYFPGEEDAHLFGLENEVRKTADRQGVDLETLMGDGKGCVTYSRTVNSPSAQRRRREEVERADSFQFTARIPEKSLRCLNI